MIIATLDDLPHQIEQVTFVFIGGQALHFFTAEDQPRARVEIARQIAAGYSKVKIC